MAIVSSSNEELFEAKIRMMRIGVHMVPDSQHAITSWMIQLFVM